ncbi:MAG: cation:proton antiporter, partial [Alphaproteobacteria bacterium]
MHALPALIMDLTLITIYAGIVTLLFKWLKQPVVLGYILAGILAGPYLTGLPSVTDKENITIWADIGVIFLLFGLGLEFSFKKIVNVGKAAMITANANIIFMLFIGYMTGMFLGWTTMDSLFLGGMISMSSTTIIIKAFEELNMKKMRFTDLVFGVLVVEDMVGILLLVLLPTVALSNSVDGTQLLISTSKLIFFLVFCFIIGIYIVPTFIKKVIKYLNDEMLLLIALALCLGMVVLATSAGFSSALGAFIMGSILAESGSVERIEKILKPVKDFFG